jgi:hypothetical protein
MTVLAQTIQLGVRIGIVWSAGFLIAVAVRALLPSQFGFNVPTSESTLFVPFDRVGFWTCLLATVTVTALVVLRAMIADLSGRIPQ